MKAVVCLFKANDGPLGLILVSLVNLFRILCKKVGPFCVSKRAFSGLLIVTCLECQVCWVLNLFFNFGFLLGYFLSIFDPKNLSKINQKIVNFWAQFWIFLLGVLELFGFLLGAFLGLLRLSWEASGPKNLQKLEVFYGF